MASPRPPPPPPPAPKSAFDLEITVVSAKHLKNVNWRSGDLKPYAVAYLDPDRRSATKPDDSGSTRPVWNERLTLPLPLPDFSSDASPHHLLTLTLTLDIFHSKPSETPKPLVGTARVPLKDLLLDVASSHHPPAGPTPIRTLELRRPSGRPHGKVRIKVSLRERPPPPPAPEQTYQMPGYYYSTAPPPPSRDYRSFSPPPPPLPHYTNPSPMPSQYPYSPHSSGGGYSDPYSAYYSSGAGYYSAPPAPMPARPMFYDRPANYGAPSAPAAYSPSSYEQQKAKGPRMGMGTGFAVGAVAGALGGLALEEGAKYEEEKIAERVESSLAARDDYSDYRADY